MLDTTKIKNLASGYRHVSPLRWPGYTAWALRLIFTR